MKTSTKKSLNLKRALNSRALSLCQSIASSYNFITGFMRLALAILLALWLISKPYFAHAEENVVTSNLQAAAESYAQELGGVIGNDHWTRVEFSTTYINPIVVVQRSIAAVNNTYVVGIRNVDEMGFEIRLKNCNNSTDIPIQENVNYAVIEQSQFLSAESSSAEVRQLFSWGECTTVAADITTMGIL